MISILALLFAVLIVLEIAVQKQVLMPSFAELERDDAKRPESTRRCWKSKSPSLSS
jgi:hypothetical protein